MVYDAGISADIADLFSDLATFATGSPGWTDDGLTGGNRLGLHKNNVYVQFRWDGSTPANVGIYQSLGIVAVGTDPGLQTDDSGNGAVSGTNATLATERHVPLVNSSMNRWFFEDDNYIHIVAETSSGEYRHFGFGELLETGDADYTGGEYIYGWLYDLAGAGGSGSSALRLDSSHLLDGRASGTGLNVRVATIHIEGLPGQAGVTKWGVVWGSNSTQGNDTAGNPRSFVQGGFRAGPYARALGRFSSDPSEKGLLHFYPIRCFYREGSNVRDLGTMPAVAGCNIEFFEGGQEVSVDGGSETWVVFPSKVKQAVGSRHQGIAYQKVTT